MSEQQPEPNQDQASAAAGDVDQGEQLVLTSPEDARTPKEMALWAGVILLIALTIYSPALRGDFLWDDNRHVSDNRNLRDATGLANIWTKFGLINGGTVQYYPLTHTTFWLEYQLSRAEPGAISTTIFHVNNVLLHVISAVLLWLVLRELKVPGSWVAAAIWALHPLQVESVAWISERKNVLAGVFFFAAILAYLRSGVGVRGSGFRSENAADDSPLSSPETRDPNPETRSSNADSPFDGLYWLALALYACALLSKTVTVSMPAVVLLLVWWKRGRLSMRDFLAAAPFLVIGIGMAALTSWMERAQVGARGPEWEISFTQRILIAGRAIWFYVEKNLWPVNLSFIYRRWNPESLTAAWWLFPLGVVAVAGTLFAMKKYVGRGPVVAWLIFCGVLVPALGFVNYYPMRYSFVADHFQYLAGPALIALIVAAVTVLLRRIAPRSVAAPYVMAGLELVVLSALTLMHASVFAGPLLLWDDALKKNPTSRMLHFNYGVDLMGLMDQLPPAQATPFVEEATKQFDAALKIDPRDERAWLRWGRSLLFLNKPQEALEKFDEALRVRPDFVDALVGRGTALYELKRLPESKAAFEQALAIAQKQRGMGTIPRIIPATIYQYLGRIAVEQNDLETGAQQYGEAVRIVENNSQMRYEYGTVLARQAKLLEGATTRAATLPATRVATTGAATQSATQPSEKAKQLLGAAAVNFGEAIAIRPGFVEARVALANLMMDVGNIGGARLQLEAAVRVSGNDVPPALEAAVKRWDAEFRKREAAATQRAATTGPTQPATKASGQ